MSAGRDWPRATLALAAALAAWPASGAEFDWSGFVRLGYVHADPTPLYETIVGSQQGWHRDSIAGGQLDVRLAPRWSAVAQLTLAPADQDNRRSRGELSLAALTYRASNELTLRAGKLRLPLLLNSENTGVGGAYSMAHLPDVIYALTANTHVLGGQASRSWDLALGELTLDGYAGRGEVLFRQVGPDADGAAPRQRFQPAARGAVLTLRRGEDVYRAAWHHFGLDDSHAPADGAGSIGLGGGAAGVVTAGASLGLAPGWRATAELARQQGNGQQYYSAGGYLSLERQLGAWTPYVTVARLHTRLAPASAPSLLVPDTPRLASAALGVALDAGAGASWKAEWQRVSCHAPDWRGAGEQSSCQRAWSLAYTRTF